MLLQRTFVTLPARSRLPCSVSLSFGMLTQLPDTGMPHDIAGKPYENDLHINYPRFSHAPTIR